jgi:hypothetical protein
MTLEDHISEITNLREGLEARDLASNRTPQIDTSLNGFDPNGIYRQIEEFPKDDFDVLARRFERRLFQDLSKAKEIRIKKLFKLEKKKYPIKFTE